MFSIEYVELLSSKNVFPVEYVELLSSKNVFPIEYIELLSSFWMSFRGPNTRTACFTSVLLSFKVLVFYFYM